MFGILGNSFINQSGASGSVTVISLAPRMFYVRDFVVRTLTQKAKNNMVFILNCQYLFNILISRYFIQSFVDTSDIGC